MNTVIKFALTSAAVIGLSSAMTSYADEYTSQVHTQLASVKIVSAFEGWEETHNDYYEALDQGDSESFELTLRRGTSYKIVSACDSDCNDIDLALYDENDNLISRDEGVDDFPVVDVTPRWSGRFTLKVKMYSCSSEPCHYAVSVLGQ